jgi:tRNA pseudouridine32 synthase / 23S rRNA pseudouridine746 synthase
LIRDRLLPVHRLDQDTSGILLLAKGRESQRLLQRQFQQQQVSKTYEAILQGQPLIKGGLIDLPLAADPEHRPRQRVDYVAGKPSQTRFTVLERRNGQSRVRFEPMTGRTHQLRVHAAEGLGMAILGDRLYGAWGARGAKLGETDSGALSPANPDPRRNRLHLHANRLDFNHPSTGEGIMLLSPVPF